MLLEASKSGTIYRPGEISKVLKLAFDGVNLIGKVGKNGGKIYNCPCSFDIETTSFYNKGEKAACMYEWTLGLNGAVIVGRTWEEFEDVMETITSELHLDPNGKRIIIYVRNLAFEFGFICRRFEWSKVFAVDTRKPVQAITSTGIEFRCSYLLTGYSLEMSGKLLTKYKVGKQVGSLNYELPRHSGTELTDEEIKYCVFDVLVDMCCIQEKIEYDGNITRIPLTKTGYVRRYLRNCCYYDETGNHHKNTDKYHKYSDLMQSLTLTVDDYLLAKRVFAGGFTHQSAWKQGRILYDVGSEDETSAYPYHEVVSDRFPMSAPEVYQITGREDFIHQINCYACMFDVRIWGLKSKTTIDHPLSFSKCAYIAGYTTDNGRVVKADYVETSLTELDYETIDLFYSWDKIQVGNFRRMIRGRLPKDLIAAVLELYRKKTELKGIKERETEYQRSKEDINANYGCMIMDPVRPEYVFEDGVWNEPELPNLEEAIEKMNNDKKRFTYYLWGIYITALNRNRVFMAMLKINDDYAYTDTDSLKYTDPEQYEEFFRIENEKTVAALEKAMDDLGLDRNLIRPKTIKGEEKPLGVWDQEHPYTRFKALRAKCYMTESREEVGIIRTRRGTTRPVYRKLLSMTVAGIDKKKAVPYMLKKYGGNTGAFEAFENDLVIPANHTGKLIHTYIEEDIDCIMTDYTGQKGEVHELSAVHLEPTEYHFNLGTEFLQYLESLTLTE